MFIALSIKNYFDLDVLCLPLIPLSEIRTAEVANGTIITANKLLCDKGSCRHGLISTRYQT